jgi:hypothetical protein
MGFIKELGFWGCLNKWDSEKTALCGFYLDNPKTVTEYGKKVLAERFQGKTLLYIMFDELPKEVVDEKELAVLRKKAVEMGVSIEAVANAKRESIENLIEAKEFDKKNEPKPKTSKPKIPKPVSDNPADDIIKKAVSRTKKVSASVSA